jgi:cell division protein FtsL
MITIIIILLILNFLFAKLMVYTVLQLFKLVSENQEIFLQMFQKNIVDWAVYFNHKNDIIKKSSFPHIPIVNIITSISCIVFIQFFKNKIK